VQATPARPIFTMVRTFGVSRATIYRALHASEQDETRSWPPSRPAPSTTVQLGALGTAGRLRGWAGCPSKQRAQMCSTSRGSAKWHALR